MTLSLPGQRETRAWVQGWEPYYSRVRLAVPLDTPEAKRGRQAARLDRLERIRLNVRLTPNVSLFDWSAAA